MNTQTLIDSYTNEVARRLPRRLRNEVGLELRALLADEIKAAAAKAGREPDEAMTVAALTRLGRPDEVAARYAPPRRFIVIEPEHGPSFVRVAAFFVLAHWALSLPIILASPTTLGPWWLTGGLGAFAWVGLLVVWYGLAGWMQRRYPIDPHSFHRPWAHYVFWVPVVTDWQPGIPDPEELVYGGAKVLIPLSALLTVVFVSPASVLGFAFFGSVDTSWALYDPGFQRWMLIPLIALMVTRLFLFSVAAFNVPFRSRTERLRFGLWVAFVVLLIWTLFGWQIFANVVTDVLFKLWLAIFILANGFGIWRGARRAVTRVRVPDNLASSQRDWVAASRD